MIFCSVHLSVYLLVFSLVYLHSEYQFACLTIRLCPCLTVYTYVYLCLPFRLCVCSLFICLPTCLRMQLTVNFFVFLSVYFLFLHKSLCWFIYESLCQAPRLSYFLSAYVSACLFICLCIYLQICMFIYTTVCLYVLLYFCLSVNFSVNFFTEYFAITLFLLVDLFFSLPDCL